MNCVSPAIRSPYKLFDSYEFADHDLFFGREEEVIRTVGEVLSTRLLVLFAPSGSGKSSLINAGVRPKLEERDVLTVTVRLSCAPDLAIKRRLREDLPEHFASLTDDADLLAGLRAAYDPADGKSVPKPLVIFLDQFEEFFIIFRSKPSLRRRFIEQVSEIRFDVNLPVYLVLSLREDYFVDLNEFREEIPSIFHNNANIQLRPLDDDAALRAITGPAAQIGLNFETGLPERIVRDLKALHSPHHHARGEHEDGTERGDHLARRASQSIDTPGDPGIAGGAGVLPITLQIVCHNLWVRRPGNGQPITHQLYAGKEGLGGAAAIIRNQLDRSLRQVPRSQAALMCRLFRVMMTADVTKRLRSVDDLAEILGIRDRRKLQALLTLLTEASVLRVEHSEKQAWYEFRHDYLVREVKTWLERVEGKRKRRRFYYAICAGVVPALYLIGLGLFLFSSTVVRVRFGSVSNYPELVIERRLNPLNMRIETGLRVSDLEQDNVAGFERLVTGGLPLPFGRVTEWGALATLFDSRSRGGFMLRALNDTNGIRGMLLKDVDEVVRVARVEPDTREQLIGFLKEEDEVVRWRAAVSLAELGYFNEPVSKTLEAALKSTSHDDQWHVAVALGLSGRDDATVMTILVAGLGDHDNDVRLHSMEALTQYGKRHNAVVRSLLSQVERWDGRARRNATAIILEIGKDSKAVSEDLVAALNDPDSLIRQDAATILGQLGNGDQNVVGALRRMLADEESSVRVNAAVALTECGEGDARVVGTLQSAFAEESVDSRFRAARALVALGQDKDKIINFYLVAIEHGEGRVRDTAALALGQLGKGNASVTESLLRVVRNEKSDIRGVAARALGELGDSRVEVLDVLLTAFKEGDDLTRIRAGIALGQLGSADDRVSEALVASLSGESFQDRAVAAMALARLGNANDTVIEALVTAVKTDDLESQEVVAQALAGLGRKRVDWTDGRLLDLLQDDRSGWRWTAEAVLADRSTLSPDTYERIKELRRDPRPWVRIAAWDTLLRIESVRAKRQRFTVQPEEETLPDYWFYRSGG